jgi:hypothetical protein
MIERPERDPNFPALPFVSDEERSDWSEEDKWARHLLEIEQNALLFNQRMREGMTPVEAALLPYPTPWMNGHSLTDLLEMRRRSAAPARRRAP